MAEGKKSFILYLSQRPIFDGLSDEDAGKLIKTIFAYVSDENPEPTGIAGYSFNIIKPILKEDLKKFETKKAKNSENIKKRWNKKANENIQSNTNEYERIKSNSDIDIVIDIDNKLSNDNIINNKVSKDTMSRKNLDCSKEIIEFLNKLSGKRYTVCNSTTRLIQARLNEGRSLEDFKYVIENKCTMWKGTDMEMYLRPETLFSAKHFESYLNEQKVNRLKDNPIYDNNGGFESL